ncbi:MAG: LysM peptidoglycan-binding domain-containing protein [Gammaproteobacteria bacterium]|uniref:LysM peptidoglycan-binding domain-containing protein n=1 Tax=Pseudomaricurvus alcaniphilus TaxID=1166482 RepID=UPI00140AF3AD|nr:LysM peptidoglycan-binding domain-containing protein [Pseudomaricurvus alcaniphilus]MBR9912630.1 LysM peptidoglycan-binding domain-containing protein [Gammaproteobacteria bacterium]NHN38813.1 LysM peptidoglycan-binding domain-containing protein [Pseudomaricurvus alcaniphilus]
MKKLLVACLLFGLAFGSGAEDVRLRGSHPDSYTVVKGDTLWDISGRFLENPWMWPEIWHVNPQIENPHLIYPGDVVRLIYLDGKPRLTVDRGSRSFKLSPAVRIKALDQAIPAIPLDEINHFLSRSRVVAPEELSAAPYVLTGAEQHLIVGAGDSLYARGAFIDDVNLFGIYRAGQKFIDPETGELLGLQALDIGSVRKKVEQADIGTFEVTRTTEEIRISDRLLPHEERTIDPVFLPSKPDSDIEGQIMAVEGGLTQVGPMSVVAVNRGDRDGLVVGNVMAIYKDGGTVRDRIVGDLVKLPDEKAGLLMVFRTFEKMSFALVLEASRPLAVKDRVSNP